MTTELAGDMLLTDLGINSLRFVELVVEIERAFGIEAPDDLLAGGFDTLDEFVTAILSLAKVE